MIYSLYIISKAGGLMYQKDFNEGLAHLTANEYLVLAGTFHGNSTSSGLEVLEADSFKLYCFQTLTGGRTYDVYSDYVMKNPFYTPEMPIRSELFDVNIAKLIKQVGS
ncbi:1524_t:CDS:2 [Scutellospora calospora]|uniref:1524_t:CDS:1 n=1 Tax=Scutellospora calospora TaxID=85575 RepID=A0ACA9L8I0_9GLOM|nr:1524_t:CDS:2 [Scutellospora calospora]